MIFVCRISSGSRAQRCNLDSVKKAVSWDDPRRAEQKKHTSTNEHTAWESVLHSGHADRLPCLLLFCIPLRQRILINWLTCPLPLFVSLGKLPPPPFFFIQLSEIRQRDCVSHSPYLLPGSVRTFSQAKEKKVNELDSVFYQRRNGLSSFQFNDARQCNEL